MAQIVFGVLSAFIGLILCGVSASTGPTSVTIICVLIIAIGIGLVIAGVRQRKKVKRAKQEMDAKAQELGAQWHAEFLHTNGLPIAENTKCSLFLGNSQLTVAGAGQQFSLAVDKITDVSITTDTEIQKSYTSSVGGAVGGAILFGPLGAMIGGRAKEKKSTVVTNYLIITYQSNGEVKYIGFELQPQHMGPAKKLCKLFSDSRLSQGQNSTIEL